MESSVGLMPGSKVAVLGGGVTGAAMAAALLYSGRSRGRTLEVKVFEGADAPKAPLPVLLTPECRSRLAALGCRVSQDWRVAELRGVELIHEGRTELLPCASGGVWVMDDWPRGECGKELTARDLSSVAALHGAQFVSRRVDRVQRSEAPGGTGPLGPGHWVVRAHGMAERFHAVALATGAAEPVTRGLVPGLETAPTVPAVYARLRYPPFRALPPPAVARLVLAPRPGVEALFLIPCAHSTFALGFGAQLQPAELCEALMMASRDGLLHEGFEITELARTQLPDGVGRRLTGPGAVAVGTAAFGHALQLGLSDALASCSRAAMALVDSGDEAFLLRQRYVEDGVSDLAEVVRDATVARRWLSRAGARTLRAFRKAYALHRAPAPFSGGILGLPTPTAARLRRQARREAWLNRMEQLLWPTLPALPLRLPVASNLFYVVDDDPDMREALTAYLQDRGAEVVAFGDELALYCAVARRPPTAILLDVVLNWVDGLSLCEGLKQHPLTRSTRVYVMSGLDRPHIRARALEAGAEAFLAKPLDPAALWDALSGELGDVPEDPPSRHDASGLGA